MGSSIIYSPNTWLTDSCLCLYLEWAGDWEWDREYVWPGHGQLQGAGTEHVSLGPEPAAGWVSHLSG